GIGLASAVAVATTVGAVVSWHRAPTPARAEEFNAAIREALRSFAPEAVVYFSSPASSTYALTVWTEVINALRPRTVVLVREAVHLPELDAIRVPIVVLPTATDVEAFHLDSMRVVLYPTNVIRNNHMVRLPGLLHCFVGHGDSDKAGSFSPVSRMYDEIWVAGQAGVDRYRAAAEGFILDRVRIVGRPQLAHIRPGAPLTPDRRLTVLYAPTWEGFFDLSDYSSVAPMGAEIVSALLTRGARVLYKPHPATGQRLPDATRVSDEIAERLASAGGGSGVVEPAPGALYDAFNEADVVVTDVSSVISDFLASRKPLIVTNPKHFPAADFDTMFPSTRAGYVIGEPAELDVVLDDIVSLDSMRQQREQYARYLLGERHGDPFARFLDEVDAFVGRADEELKRRKGARAQFERSSPWLAP
ncbi:MAG: CDP-glycerol glycerophosphotransferase family protein, partial [Actinomycetota bacterium]|nr:CDP-glycerol glycerophosphotransferase family protein [Actinomycetota bacterium]